MNRNQCMEILSDKSHPHHKEFSHTFRINYNKCRKYYDSLGYKGYTLHHKIVGCDNYEEWKIDEIEPMLRNEHSKLHIVCYKQGLGTAESLKKAHDSLRKKYASGELTVWNKGKSGMQVSPRKGKTGKDFPFLCASKKGKSGGWNKSISRDDPRYISLTLAWTDERKQDFSERMKQSNPMFKEENRIKQLESIRDPSVQQRRADKIRGRKRYTNGKEVHMFQPGTEPHGYVLTKDYKG